MNKFMIMLPDGSVVKPIQGHDVDQAADAAEAAGYDVLDVQGDNVIVAEAI